MKILSFIIPAYNSAAFLDKCIGSMLEPTVLDRLEILVVNDGSTDITAQIAEGYCRRFPDTVRLISQENKGHGGALNTGLAAARGEYLKVVDADDWVQTRNLPEFIRRLERCDSDVVLTHYRTIDITTGEVKNWRAGPPSPGRAYTMEQVAAGWGEFQWGLTLHGIAYRREFYRAMAEPLPEHVYYEDQEYAAFPSCHARSVTCLDLFIYEYRVGDASQSVAAANQLRRLDQMEAVLWRMLDRGRALPAGPGRRCAAGKTRVLALSCLKTMLLAELDRKKGRRMAAGLMALCRERWPEVYELTRRQYRVFRLLSRLGLDLDGWEKLLNSRAYALARRKGT